MTISIYDVNCFESRFVVAHVFIALFLLFSRNRLSLFRSVFQLVKTLDEQKSKFLSIAALFADDLVVLRTNLVATIETILLEEFENIGKKTRDILWRKVYYDPISISKKFWKNQSGQLEKEEVVQLTTFIKVRFTIIQNIRFLE